MKNTLLGLALVASPAVAQVPPLYPMPTPPVYTARPYVPPVYTPYYLIPEAPINTPQYIYRTYPDSTLPLLTPDFVIQQQFGNTVIRPTLPDSFIPDATKPSYVIRGGRR